MYKKFLAVSMLSICGGSIGVATWMRFWAPTAWDPFSRVLLEIMIALMVALTTIMALDVFLEFRKKSK